jgi:hypothetical protein
VQPRLLKVHVRAKNVLRRGEGAGQWRKPAVLLHFAADAIEDCARWLLLRCPGEHGFHIALVVAESFDPFAQILVALELRPELAWDGRRSRCCSLAREFLQEVETYALKLRGEHAVVGGEVDAEGRLDLSLRRQVADGLQGANASLVAR